MSEEEPVKRLNAAAFFTGVILVIYTGVGVGVYLKGDSNQFAAYVQATIALAMMAAGYWYGTSKSSSDKDEVTKELLTKGANNATEK